MKSVSRFEANLLRLLYYFLQQAPVQQALPLLEAKTDRPRCLSRNAVELVKDALGKGCVRLLEDRDDDGVFDKSTLFAEDVPMACAVACWDGGVLVGSPLQVLTPYRQTINLHVAAIYKVPKGGGPFGAITPTSFAR